jgi:hypothetical protein
VAGWAKWAGTRPTRGRKEGGEGKEMGRAERSKWAALSFLFLFYTQTFKQTHLNSNKFELKPYKLNTRKIMLQHECTNNLIL